MEDPGDWRKDLDRPVVELLGSFLLDVGDEPADNEPSMCTGVEPGVNVPCVFRPLIVLGVVRGDLDSKNCGGLLQNGSINPEELDNNWNKCLENPDESKVDCLCSVMLFEVGAQLDNWCICYHRGRHFYIKY